jgi:hypothetical protein
MTHFLLSMHTVADQAPVEMTEQQVQATMRQVGELEADMGSTQALVASGRLADAGSARVVRVEDGETTTSDGPFADAAERLGGFYIIEAADLDEAISWASRTSAAIGRPIEVRAFDGFRVPGAS